jgi:hypothetical protein
LQILAKRESPPQPIPFRMLILSHVNVPHLTSHVRGLCARQLPGDWAARGGPNARHAWPRWRLLLGVMQEIVSWLQCRKGHS